MKKPYDRPTCDRIAAINVAANKPRDWQPRRSYEEVILWLHHDQYWSDSCSIRSLLDDCLFHIATQPANDGLELYISSRMQRENWPAWPQEEKDHWTSLIFRYWCVLLNHPPATTFPVEDPLFWHDTQASRIFNLASELDELTGSFFKPLYSTLTDPDRFLMDCLFALENWKEFSRPSTNWAKYLPPRDEVIRHIQEGFYIFAQHEQVASMSEEMLNYFSRLFSPPK